MATDPRTHPAEWALLERMCNFDEAAVFDAQGDTELIMAYFREASSLRLDDGMTLALRRWLVGNCGIGTILLVPHRHQAPPRGVENAIRFAHAYVADIAALIYRSRSQPQPVVKLGPGGDFTQDIG